MDAVDHDHAVRGIMKGCHYAGVIQAVLGCASGDQLLPAGQGVALLHQGRIRSQQGGFAPGDELPPVFRDAAGHLGGGRTRIGGIELKTGIFQRVMAGGEIYRKGRI